MWLCSGGSSGVGTCSASWLCACRSMCPLPVRGAMQQVIYVRFSTKPFCETFLSPKTGTMRWYAVGAVFRPMGSTNHSYTPHGVTKAVYCLLSGAKYIWWNPSSRSKTGQSAFFLCEMIICSIREREGVVADL